MIHCVFCEQTINLSYSTVEDVPVICVPCSKRVVIKDGESTENTSNQAA